MVLIPVVVELLPLKRAHVENRTLIPPWRAMILSRPALRAFFSHFIRQCGSGFVSPPRLSTYISHLAKCFADFSGLRSALLFLRGGGVGCIGHRGRRFLGGFARGRRGFGLPLGLKVGRRLRPL